VHAHVADELELRFDPPWRPEAMREPPVLPPLHLQNLRATPVVVPLRRRLATRVAVLDEVPLVLLDLETVEGVVGRAYVVAYHVDALPACSTCSSDGRSARASRPRSASTRSGANWRCSAATACC